MWGREWVLATYKHPGLPGWALELARLMLGTSWSAYLVSQLFVAATFALVFCLGRDLMDGPRAAAGTLLLAGVGSYSWLTPEFNHNIAQLPFWAGFALALWRAVERRSLLWWVWTAFFAAGGMYAKLTTALLLVAMAFWVAFDSRARRSLVSPGPWIALALFVFLVFPLIAWLVQHNFLPLHYALQRAQSGSRLIRFALGVLGNIIGLPVMLFIAVALGPKSLEFVSAVSSRSSVDARRLHYLAFLSFGPLLLAMTIIIESGGLGLRPAWTIPMFNFLGLLAIATVSARFHPRILQRIAVMAGGLLLAIPIGYTLVVRLDLLRSGKPMRVSWPQAEIADRFYAIWWRETGTPLRIVAGDGWVAGLVGITAQGNPSIFETGDMAISPWITRERLASDGMLLLWDGSQQLPKHWVAFAAERPVREERFTYDHSAQTLRVRYVVVHPSVLGQVAKSGSQNQKINHRNSQLDALNTGGRFFSIWLLSILALGSWWTLRGGPANGVLRGDCTLEGERFLIYFPFVSAFAISIPLWLASWLLG